LVNLQSKYKNGKTFSVKIDTFARL
jgi:hypothetical protein